MIYLQVNTFCVRSCLQSKISFKSNNWLYHLLQESEADQEFHGKQFLKIHHQFYRSIQKQGNYLLQRSFGVLQERLDLGVAFRLINIETLDQ